MIVDASEQSTLAGSRGVRTLDEAFDGEAVLQQLHNVLIEDGSIPEKKRSEWMAPGA